MNPAHPHTAPISQAPSHPVSAAPRRSVLPMLCCLAALGLALALLGNGYWIKTFTSALALSIAVAGVALLYGQLGLVSLAQYALVGTGGWIALRLVHGTGLPFSLCVLLGGLGSGLIGMIAGLPALRLRGLYLALVTLMIAGAYQVLITATGFPDGGDGWLGRVHGTARHIIPRPALAASDTAYLIYVVLWLGLILLLLEAHRRRKPGRAWALIRRGNAAALAAGVDILRYQAWAFGLAGFCAGVGGALLAGGIGQLDGRAFQASESVMLFALTVIAGAYHWLGIILAGFFLRVIPGLLTDFGVSGYVATMFFGAALLHALITAPRGIAGQWLDGLARLRSRRQTRKTAHTESAP